MEVIKDNSQMLQNTLSEYGDLLSVPDLANIFGVSKQTIYRELKSDTFGTPIKIGRALKIPKIRIIKNMFTS